MATKKNTQNAQANESKVRFQSENSFVVTGRLVESVDKDSQKSDNYARFRIAHNFGKNMDALYTDIVMFNKNGKKNVDIPWDLLKKGTMVRVSGFRKPNNYEKDGQTIYRQDFVGLTVEACPVRKEA